MGRLRQEGRVPDFETKRLPATPDVTAPDGSGVRLLLALKHGSMAHFELAHGLVSIAVAHRTVEEIWYFLSGSGEMWRRAGDRTEVTPLEPGVSITIPRGTAFQFRSDGAEPLTAVAITMPPWPGAGEAYTVDGPWQPNLGDV
jgi:mannose-6-phosphate isomerase-like protein (cupin superfamily)